MAGLTSHALTNRSASSAKSKTPNPAPLSTLTLFSGLPGAAGFLDFGPSRSRSRLFSAHFPGLRASQGPLGCGGIPGPCSFSRFRLFQQLTKTPASPGPPCLWGLLGAFKGPPRACQGPPRAFQGPLRGLSGLQGTFWQNFNSSSCFFNVWIPRPFEGPAKSFSRASPDPGLHLLSPVKGPLLAHRAFQSKNHKISGAKRPH